MKRERSKRFLIIPLFLPFEGCENRCIYCNQRALHPEMINLSKKEIEKTIKQYLASFKGERGLTTVEVAFYGGTFTAIEKERQIELLSIVNGFILDSTIDGIRFSTRPDRLPIEMLDVYRRFGVSTIEIGAQSFKDSVLRFIKRNHTAQDVRDAVYRLKEHGFRTSIHLMLGLPSSSHNDDIYSIEETIKLQPDYVRLHPTLVLKDTELEELYRSGKYTPLSLSEAIKILKYALKRFSESNIRVIRVGLHNDDNLVNPETLVAGPFHPSLRELALSSHSNSKIEQT